MAQAAPNQEEMLEQFLKLISPPKVVNTYKNAIVIQSTIDGDWGDIWDFSLVLLDMVWFSTYATNQTV